MSIVKSSICPQFTSAPATSTLLHHHRVIIAVVVIVGFAGISVRDAMRHWPRVCCQRTLSPALNASSCRGPCAIRPERCQAPAAACLIWCRPSIGRPPRWLWWTRPAAPGCSRSPLRPLRCCSYLMGGGWDDWFCPRFPGTTNDDRAAR